MSRRRSASPADLARWRRLWSSIPGYDPVATAGDTWFDATTADGACRFFETELTHIEGELAGKPFKLPDWQRAIIGALFGWKTADRRRRYQEAFIYVPRKNGKSTFVAGLVNMVALCDGEAGAQIYSAAADREQAALVYRQAKGMILNNPRLSPHCRIYSTYKSIEYPGGAIYKAISADADTKHGFNSHMIVVDELHAHANRDLVDVLLTSTGSRRQPLVLFITTADFIRESICNEKYDYACNVRDGVIVDPSFLPVIYEAKADADWTSESTWRQANPNLGVSLGLDYMRRECQRAREVPSFENTFKRLHLNIRTQTDVRWLSLPQWDACGDAISDDELAGSPCFGGLDLATTTDLAALALLFEVRGRLVIRPWFWVPEQSAEKRERRDRVPYRTWAKAGHIEMTAGNVIDYDVIRRRINELNQRFQILDLAVDRWNATQIMTQLQGDGINVVQFGQGFASMSGPTKELERRVVAGSVAHGNNPVLRWCVNNTMVEQDAAGNIKPSKRKSKDKIDGVVAAIMALGRLMVRPIDSPTVYESRGLIVL